MTKDERIRGKVAAILSKRELILNIGTDQDVVVGMRFVVLNSKGIDVRDPDTLEVIGTAEVPKTVVKVVRVDGPKLSVARTYRTIKGSPGVLGGVARLSKDMYGSADRVETLAIESGATLKAELSEEESYVKIGDVALQTTGDEYDDLG